MWRIRLWVEKIGWKPIAIGAAVLVVVLVAAGAAFAVPRGDRGHNRIGNRYRGLYRKKFTRKGLALDVGPVSLLGGYTLWSARVTAMDGDPPGNDTTVQTATPPGTKCD